MLDVLPLRGWDDGGVGPASGRIQALPDLVRRAASAHCNESAVSGSSSHLTYGEMQRRVTAVAEQLLAAGVAPGDVVGVAASRSHIAPVLILGIMCSGATYLPLDPLYPDALLTRMARAAGVQTIVLDQASGGRTPAVTARVIESAAMLSTPPTGSPLPAIDVRGAAYAMFTSGSTGEPKGVVLGHTGLGEYARALPARVGLRAGDRCLGVAPLGFSSSIRQLLLPLAAGATVVVPTEEQMRAPWAFADLIRDERVSHLDVTSSYWSALLDALPEDEARAMLTRVRRVLFASERLDPQLGYRTRRLAPHARIWNMYGCTETTGIVTTYELTGREAKDAPVPIGTALDHVTVTVTPGTDEHSGARLGGQITVTGSAVALGFLGRLPVRPGHATRRLGTGDRAEVTAAGLVWLGRGDRMFKVRGMRVTAESVEQHLLAHSGVRRAAVVAATERGLLCAIEPASLPGPDPNRIAAWLRERLPAHMVPTEIILTIDWPLLPNGKTDHRELAARCQPTDGSETRGTNARR